MTKATFFSFAFLVCLAISSGDIATKAPRPVQPAEEAPTAAPAEKEEPTAAPAAAADKTAAAAEVEEEEVVEGEAPPPLDVATKAPVEATKAPAPTKAPQSPLAKLCFDIVADKQGLIPKSSFQPQKGLCVYHVNATVDGDLKEAFCRKALGATPPLSGLQVTVLSISELKEETTLNYVQGLSDRYPDSTTFHIRKDGHFKPSAICQRVFLAEAGNPDAFPCKGGEKARPLCVLRQLPQPA